MNWVVALRPRRTLVFPLLMALFPTLYFVTREASTACASGGNCPDPVYAGYALLGIAASYLLACATLAVVDVRAFADTRAFAGVRALAADRPAVRLALRPTDAALGVLAVLVTGIVAYVAASLVTTIPSWLDLVLTPFGVVVGLPFVATSVTMTVVGSALSVEPSMAVQIAVVAVSLAITGAWVFLLATGVAGALGGALSVGADSR